TTDVARRPSHMTVMVVEPLISAVTSPVLDTLPTAGSLLVQLIARPRTARPEASHIAADSCTVPRTTTSTDSGTIVTAEMGGGGACADSLVEACAGRGVVAHRRDAARRWTRAARRGQTRHPDSRVGEALTARRRHAHHRAPVTGVKGRCVHTIPGSIDALR